jgi:hypothetical protein
LAGRFLAKRETGARLWYLVERILELGIIRFIADNEHQKGFWYILVFGIL